MANIATFKQSHDIKFWECSALHFDEENDTNWFSETKVTFQILKYAFLCGILNACLIIIYCHKKITSV